ncbi:hypothetical protein PZN56_05545 [Staphylococcus epidermidis]|nr:MULTISPECIES: hypothetical protein [Staphylococcus]MDU2120510.1 hypothetical protein [Staphylococcus aureus]MDU3189246.1 hypothetical protein [Streptococcus mitis]MCG7794953.1 hypothetical protein [Staphylococcus epidermidis]MDH8928294.1 hypothetical protein [Staphylococcus epidermidis]MDH8937475.1 hypothetical protein [Staphylococcus epidermidis]
MKKNDFPFFNNFYKKRTSPKWGFNLFIAIVFSMISAVFLSQIEPRTSSINSVEGISKDTMEMLIRLFVAIFGGFSSIISVLLIFILSLIVTKIFKSNPRTKSLFSGSILLVLIINIITLIITMIQFGFSLSPEKYNILSLNIFNPGNEILGSFDLKLVIQSYLFTLLLHCSGKLSIKKSIISSIVLFVILLFINLIGASI